MEVEGRYVIEIYCGGIYCGCALKDSYDDCIKFLEEDGMCDMGKIANLETGEKKRVKITPKEA